MDSRGPPRRWTFGVDVSPDRIPVYSLFFGHATDGQSLPLCLLYGLLPLPLKESGLARLGRNDHLPRDLLLCVKFIFLCFVWVLPKRFSDRSRWDRRATGDWGRDTGGSRGRFAGRELFRSAGSILGGDDASLMLQRQPTIQPFQDDDSRSGISTAQAAGDQLQGAPVKLHSVVHGYQTAMLETQNLLEEQLWAHGGKEESGHCGGT